MFDLDYDWILDFINVNDEKFHNELFEMVKDLPRYVYKQLKEKEKLHIVNSKYELTFGRDNDTDGEKLFLNIDKGEERFSLIIKKLTEKDLENIVSNNLDYDILTLEHLYNEYDVGVYHKIKLDVSDKDNINVISTRVVNGLFDYENSYPIEYEDILQTIDAKQTRKR